MKKTVPILICLAALMFISLTGCQKTPAQDSLPPQTNTPSVPTQPDPPDGGEDNPPQTADPETPDQETTILLYLPNDTADGLVEEPITMSADASSIVSALAQRGAIPENTAVNSFALQTQSDGKRIGALDLSQEFAIGMQSMGTSGERMCAAALVNTLIHALDLDAVSFTCDGAVVETGHSYYDEPLELFEFESAQ